MASGVYVYFSKESHFVVHSILLEELENQRVCGTEHAVLKS